MFLYLREKAARCGLREGNSRWQTAERRNGEALFCSWSLAQTKEELRPRIAAFAAEMGVTSGSYFLLNQKTEKTNNMLILMSILA